MASLLARLSWNNKIRPKTFIGQLLEKKRHSPLDLGYPAAKVFNGCMAKTLIVAEQVAELLSVNASSLSNQHFYELGNIIDGSACGFMSRFKRWCPFCYQEQLAVDKGENRCLYDLLYWSLEEIKICFKHSCYLVDRCSQCGSTQPYISNNVEPGYCDNCAAFLGRRIAQEIDHVLYSNQESFLDSILSLKKVCDCSYLGKLRSNMLAAKHKDDAWSIEALSQAAGLTAETIYQWSKGNKLPTLRTLIKLQHVLSFPSLRSLFYGEEFFLLYLDPCFDEDRQWLTMKEKQELYTVKMYLNKILSGILWPASEEQLIKQLGVTESYLKEHFAEQLKIITSRYREAQLKVDDDRENDLAYLVEQAVKKCLSNNKTLTWENILSFFPADKIGQFTTNQFAETRKQVFTSLSLLN